jgi:phosphatidyl-myo-inositol dimannoside synthase
VTSRILVGAATVAAGNGGIARVARLSAKALQDSGQAVELLSYLDTTKEVLDGVTSVACSGSKPQFIARSYASSLKATHALYDTAGLARAAPALPGLRRPLAIWMHGIEAWEALRPKAAATLARASLVLVNSHHTLARYEQLHGALPHAAVCWLATEVDTPAAMRPQPAGGEPKVLILGRVSDSEDYKGHEELIACWPIVLAAAPTARLVIVGGGSGLAALRARVASSPAAANIDVLGFVAEADMEAIWSATTVFAMPSRGEGFGLVYIEAMRFGIPVIASTHDAGQEVNVDRETGFNVSLDAAYELPGKLVALLTNAELAGQMGHAGRKRWQTHFCYSAFRQRFMVRVEPFLKTGRPPK